MNRYSLIFIIFILTIQTTYGQELHKDIQEIYNFEPHKVHGNDREIKIKLMDSFWEKVTKNKDKYLNELRTELKDTSNSSFFLYDGGHLLLSLSKSKDDYQIALDAMSKCNLKDIDRKDFLRTMNFFAYNGLNTTDAAIKIITADTFWVYIPQHALMLDKYLSLIFVLLPIQKELYLTKVINELQLSKDTATIKEVLHFLDYTCTCQADSIILKYSMDKNLDTDVQKIAALIVYNNSKVVRRDRPKQYKKLTKKRKEILIRISDEALYELDAVTNKLKGNYNCR